MEKKHIFHFFSKFRRLLRLSGHDMPHVLQRRSLFIFRVGLLASAPVYNVKIAGDLTPKSLESPDVATLTHGYLIRNAALASVDAATALLNQTSGRLLELEARYAQALHTLVRLLETHMSVQGDATHEAHVWDAILAARYNLANINIDKQELEMMYQSSVKMMEAAAESVHLAGATFAGSAVSERLHSTKTQVDLLRRESQEQEKRLRKIEVKNIEAVSKAMKEKQQKLTAEKLRQQATEEKEQMKSGEESCEDKNTENDQNSEVKDGKSFCSENTESLDNRENLQEFTDGPTFRTGTDQFRTSSSDEEFKDYEEMKY